MRINRYLATCGISSRRKAEEIILSGRVKLNGRPITELSCDIKDKDIVTVDDKRVEPINKHIYIVLNKPKGYITSTSDERGRKTVMDLIKAYRDKRLFPVGRLDYDTEGLLLMTTDGALAEKLTHPSYELPKTYIAKIEGEIQESDLNKLRNGVIIDGEKTKKCKVTNLKFEDNITRLEVIISQGRNRQIKKMFESINRQVIFLKRTAIGPLRLGGLSRGEYRLLTEKELKTLKSSI